MKLTKILLTIIGGGSLILAVGLYSGCKNNKKSEVQATETENVLESANSNNNFNGIIIGEDISSTKEFSLDGPIASIYHDALVVG